MARAALSCEAVSKITTQDIQPTYKFVILDVQEDEFRPEVGTFSSLDDLRDVDTGDEELQVLHDWSRISKP